MLTNVRANIANLARLAAFCVAVEPVISCDASQLGATDDRSKTGAVAQAFTDTDSDGMADSFEITYFGDLSQTASGDYDGDGMLNIEEFGNGFDPTVADAFNDADGDRYPNIHELRHSTDPNDAGSTPAPDYVVDPAGAGGAYVVSRRRAGRSREELCSWYRFSDRCCDFRIVVRVWRNV